MKYSHYPEKWQKRFVFFEENGAPHTASHKEKIKSLRIKGMTDPLLINTNFYAFFFGFFYFFALGLWKKGLSLLAISFLWALLILPIEHAIGMNLSATGIGIAILAARTANYSYYLKEIKREDSWNLLQGFSF